VARNCSCSDQEADLSQSVSHIGEMVGLWEVQELSSSLRFIQGIRIKLLFHNISALLDFSPLIRVIVTYRTVFRYKDKLLESFQIKTDKVI